MAPLNAHYFKVMLKKDLNAVVTRWDHAGWSALHYAAYNNKYDIMIALIGVRAALFLSPCSLAVPM